MNRMSPYQYQIGDILFGRNTNIPISSVEPQPYNVNAQDFQIPLTDENKFGVDTLVPGPIIFNMAILENYMLDQFSNVVPGNIEPDDVMALRGTILGKLARLWKAKEVRTFWGMAMPLYFCDGNGQILRIYGRPGKFQYKPRANDRNSWIDIQAEFRRADTYAHSHIEYYIGDEADPHKGMAPDADPVTAVRGDGDGDSWVRVLIFGPATHPVITYGDNTIELALTIPAGVVLELSSYPWSRRIVDDTGVNHRARMIGETRYLEEIIFPADEELDISWTCTGADGDTQMYFLWREAYNVI